MTNFSIMLHDRNISNVVKNHICVVCRNRKWGIDGEWRSTYENNNVNIYIIFWMMI